MWFHLISLFFKFIFTKRLCVTAVAVLYYVKLRKIFIGWNIIAIKRQNKNYNTIKTIIEYIEVFRNLNIIPTKEFNHAYTGTVEPNTGIKKTAAFIQTVLNICYWWAFFCIQSPLFTRFSVNWDKQSCTLYIHKQINHSINRIKPTRPHVFYSINWSWDNSILKMLLL